MNKQKIALLKKARRAVVKGEFICIAIKDAALPGCPVAEQLKKYINRAIRTDTMKEQILELWLKKHRPLLPRGGQNMIRYRLQYVDWMIEQLEKP